MKTGQKTSKSHLPMDGQGKIKGGFRGGVWEEPEKKSARGRGRIRT